MLPFRAERLGELLMPEGPTLLALAAGHLIARSIDAAANLTRPWRRFSDYAHVAALGGGAYLYARGYAPEVTKTLVVGDSMLLVTSIGDVLYERTLKPAVRKVGTRRPGRPIGQGEVARQIGGGNGYREQLGAGFTPLEELGVPLTTASQIDI